MLDFGYCAVTVSILVLTLKFSHGAGTGTFELEFELELTTMASTDNNGIMKVMIVIRSIKRSLD